VRRGVLALVPLLIGLVIIAFQFFGAEKQVVPITGREQRVGMTDAEQIQLGAEVYDQVLAEVAPQVIESGPQAELVRRVAERVIAVGEADKPDFDWEVTLVDDPQSNAFCLPGGKIVVYSGILGPAVDEAGLATVMAHEVAHAIAEHGAERILKQQLTDSAVQIAAGSLSQDPEQYRQIVGLLGAGAQVGLSLPWGRAQESEADHIGLVYMARAGYDPQAAVGFWQRMGEAAGEDRPPEYLSTHPDSDTRVEDIQGWMAEAQAEYRPPPP